MNNVLRLYSLGELRFQWCLPRPARSVSAPPLDDAGALPDGCSIK